MTISVIIPTYQRPALLKKCIESVWQQTLLPNEIIIGDDSKDDLTERMVNQELIPVSPVPIRYFHHKPSLKEVRNVDFQYQQATGDLVLHLHDDDPIYPECIAALQQPFFDHPEIVASFGLQRMIDEAGNLTADAEQVNTDYFRTAGRAGLVDGFMAGAISMFPNNAFLVKKDAVLKIGYSDNGRAGKATDFYFGYRLGKLGKPFYFVNEYTAFCRIVKESQSRNSEADNDYQTVKILLEDLKPGQYTPELERVIKERMPRAITTAAQLKDKKNAFKWLLSKYYRGRLLSPRGIKRILQVINPF